MSYGICDDEIYLFNEGTNAYAYKMLGCHKVFCDYSAYRFAVYAKNAVSVSVVGSFNNWNVSADVMTQINNSGIWQIYIGIAHAGDLYKYAIRTKSGNVFFKADPFAFSSEAHGSASIVCDSDDYTFSDADYIRMRNSHDRYNSPMCIYEVHLPSWREEIDLVALAEYVSDMGFTHVELMPVCEYPLDASWGYQITGYYSITYRVGSARRLKEFVDLCHAKNIGVILDWVPAHFPCDAHGLFMFDGTHLFENEDKRLSFQPQWGTYMFDLAKPQVVSFLISNAVYFLKEFHFDGLRVDAVSSMLYLDYGKERGQWVKNSHGGNINLDAVAFFQRLSAAVAKECSGSILIAEESTAFPLVTMPPDVGGLGFNFKWNMGYMNDTLSYMSTDSYFRHGCHNKLTFSMMYAFSENYILPFSHDEVVHGKHSLIDKMPCDYQDKFASLRLLFAYQYAHPGKKLFFMGSEFGQFIEWDYKRPLDFFLMRYPLHAAMSRFVRTLNSIYTQNAPFFALDCTWAGYSWLVVDDAKNSVIAFSRFGGGREIICVFNFTPLLHSCYHIPVKHKLSASVLLNTSDCEFGGDNAAAMGIAYSRCCKNGHCISIPLHGLGAMYLLVRKKRLRIGALCL